MSNCICNEDSDDRIMITQDEVGSYKLQFWGFEWWDDDGRNDCDLILQEEMDIYYCPICGRLLS